MMLKSIFTALLALFFTVVLLPVNANATIPVSSGFESPEKNIVIAMHYEDASLIGEIEAKFTQDLAALEHAFLKLQRDGILDSSFPRLVIIATMYYDVAYRFEVNPTVLTRTDSSFLVSYHPSSPQFEPLDLGPAYVIKTSPGLLIYEDLAAMMIKLGELNETTTSITIENEEQMQNLRSQNNFNELMNFSIISEEENISSGNLSLSVLWNAGQTTYSVIDEAGNIISELPPLDVYIGTPSWPPLVRADMQGRIIAYASKDKAIIYDVAMDRYHKLSLDFEYKEEDAKESAEYMVYQYVNFAFHEMENKVYVLPYGRMGMIIIVYSLDLDTGEWVRELEDWAVSDQVWSNISHGLWLDFVPALTSPKIWAVHILTSEEEKALWTEAYGQEFIFAEQPAEEPTILTPEEEEAIRDEETPLNNEPVSGEEVEEPALEEPASEAELVSGEENQYQWLLLLLIPAAVFVYLLKGRKKA